MALKDFARIFFTGIFFLRIFLNHWTEKNPPNDVLRNQYPQKFTMSDGVFWAYLLTS